MHGPALGVRRFLTLAFYLLWLTGMSAVLLAQAASPPAAQDQDLPADDIVAILQQNPDLLAEAKAQIAQQLHDRGYPVSNRSITDDRLFSEIRSDERARHIMSEELKKRGLVQEENPQPQPPAQAAPATNNRNQRPTEKISGDNTQPPSNVDKGNVDDQRRRPGSSAVQDQYPFRNLPALHDLYKQAVSDQKPLERFGAALFRNSTTVAPDKMPIDIPVGSDYVIGPGDELVVEYWGNSSQRMQLTVDREGRVVMPDAGAVMVAGRTLGDAQQSIQRQLTRQLRGITVDVTMGKLRTVRIYVVGDVKNPGAYDISALSSCLSALIAAGGPTEAGSYRLVKHYRGRKLMEEVDLYDLMLKGVGSAEAHIDSGDSILVPPAGPQVTVAGSVRRPAIYELRSEASLEEVLQLAGGVPVTGELNSIKLERTEAHQRRQMLSIELPPDDPPSSEESFQRVQIKDGDSVTVSPILPYSSRTVYLQGHVFRPGKYPYSDGIRVTDLVGSFDDLLPEAADRAEIVRLHPPDLSPLVIGFNLRDVLDKRASAPALQPFDTVRVFGRYDTDAPKVSIYGEVMRPGEYPLSDGMSAADLLRLAGGFKRDAFQDKADLSSYQVIHGDHVELEHRSIPIALALSGVPDTDVRLKPGDVLTIGQIGGWNDIGGAVNVAGEVLHPGRYGIQQNERLSSVLKRAGGFSPSAYPYGAVLERAQVREFEAKNRDEMVARLQEQGISGARLESSATAQQRQQLINRLKSISPSGRLLIHINEPIEKWENTPADVEVRPGDALIIPKVPDFVMVAGQVYNPAAVTFRKGRSAGWYLKQAGGPTSVANKKDIFVIRANGTVVGRSSGEWWSGSVSRAVLQPGDTIYVPDKVTGSGIFKNMGMSMQMFSGVAVAASVLKNF
ncbi:MAG TPA: SLBB domain-containing protein [Candidatus Angelobacter sp.]|nr:SLBB domain-containing protein [Candidatus Angelobacter sp.]